MEKTLVSTLHCCFVRVDRGNGSFPPNDKEGAPWFVLRDRLLRVRETRADDPEAELMVSFVMGSTALVSAKADEVELELRLQVCPCPCVLFQLASTALYRLTKQFEIDYCCVCGRG